MAISKLEEHKRVYGHFVKGNMFMWQARTVEERLWDTYMRNSIVYGQDTVKQAINNIGFYFKEDYKMNKSIATVYEVTADAVLVDKHFGNEIDQTFTGVLWLKQYKTEYLVEAKKREEALTKK